MPQVTNTFIRSKMNKDLDNRLLPNGEYRDAQNLQISRSEGSEVGEFENVLQNTELTYLYTGKQNLPLGFVKYFGKIIGQFTDETTENIYIFSSGYDGDGRCPRDVTAFTKAGTPVTTNINWVLYDQAGNLLDPTTLGLEVGMTVYGDNWNGQPSGAGGQEKDPVIERIIPPDPAVPSDGLIVISQGITLSGSNQLNFGYTNTIHRYNPTTNITTLLVRGSFLNFNQNFRIYGINLLNNLLFWTDNRNQPRKINVDLANPTSLITPVHYVNEDQISVAKYYPYETPLVLQQANLEIVSGTSTPTQPIKGYQIETTQFVGDYNVKIGDIVSGFPGQKDDEVWQVLWIEPTGGNNEVIIYNNFFLSPGTYNGTDTINIKFSRSSSSDSTDRLLTRGFDSSVLTAAGAIGTGAILDVKYNFTSTEADPSNNPTPQIGDFITSKTLLSTATGLPITLADEVCIQEVFSIQPNVNIELKLTQDVTVVVGVNDISVSANPNYGLGQTPAQEFTGDPDLIEEKFVRFSYRFKFEDNEYSLSAPFTQVCFIPEQQGIFGNGPNNQYQDQVNAYDSSIIEWFTNSIDTIDLKIPLPDSGATAAEAVTGLIDGYKVTDIEILYKESNTTSVKILEVIPVTSGLASFVEEIPRTALNQGPQWYYNFDYKSIKPYRTLPTNQQNRVYDNVPLKALGQEISANRVIYGNFLQQHTPPVSLDYEAINADKSIDYDNYAQYPNHSLKQNRNYQAGFVLADRYGRASSVVLSSNDSIPTAQGSTLYTPYKSFEDVDNIDETTYKWLGNALRIKVNNGLNPAQQINNEVTGEPGLYKAENDTSIDQLEITNGGVGYVVGDTITLQYTPGPGLGLGQLGEVEVLTVAAGVVTGVQIINRGTGYVNGNLLIQDTTSGGGTGFTCTIEVYPANPTGWQSYKIVVKQQEQEYYNVYLPGYVSGYPVIGARDYGRVAFAVLLGDNINKVPRDLNEVGPTQSEFSASVKLFGRVNNPNINNTGKNLTDPQYYENREYAWNTQYFPGRISDEVVTIGPIGSGGLELANSPFQAPATQAAFDNFTVTGPSIPWGTIGGNQLQSFYNVEQNPLALGLKTGAEESQPQLQQPITFPDPSLNTLGAKISDQTVPAPPPPGLAIGCMIPFLSVSETAPVESLLEIFYESSTSGNFVDLNRSVVAEYGGVSNTTTTNVSFAEDDINGTVILTAFSFTDSAGNELTLQSVPTISAIVDGNGVAVTGAFTIESTGGGGSLLDFDLKTNQLFAYLSQTTQSNQYFISFETTYDDGVNPVFVDNLTNQITITLNNIIPEISGFTPAYGADAGTEVACGFVGGTTGFTTADTGVFGQFTNVKNGSADPTQEADELCYSLSVASPGGTAVFSIDQTGTVTLDSGTTVNGTYTFTCTVTDASPSCVNDVNSLSVDCIIDVILGTPPVNRILCFGPTVAMNSLVTECGPSVGAGEPLEVFFGADRNVNCGIVGTAGANIGSDTRATLSTIDTALGTLGPKYGITSSNGLNLAYYNVLNEGRYGASPIQCGGVTELFTTGGLTQGVVQIVPTLTKSATAASPSTYKTNFTILYRPTPTDAWVIASCDVGSPAQPAGGTIGNFNLLEVTGAGGAVASLAYNFSAIGEYAVRNNGVYSVGCTGCTTCARFDVEYYDANSIGPGTGVCIGALGFECVGPL